MLKFLNVTKRFLSNRNLIKRGNFNEAGRIFSNIYSDLAWGNYEKIKTVEGKINLGYSFLSINHQYYCIDALDMFKQAEKENNNNLYKISIDYGIKKSTFKNHDNFYYILNNECFILYDKIPIQHINSGQILEENDCVKEIIPYITNKNTF